MVEEKKEKRPFEAFAAASSPKFADFIAKSAESVAPKEPAIVPGSVQPINLSGNVEETIKPLWGNIQGKPLTYPPSIGPIQLPAGTAVAGTAPLKMVAGVNLTTPEPGAIEFDGTNLYFTNSGGTRRTISFT